MKTKTKSKNNQKVRNYTISKANKKLQCYGQQNYNMFFG